MYCVKKETRIRNHFLEDFILRTRSKNVTYNLVTAIIKVKKKNIDNHREKRRENFIEMVLLELVYLYYSTFCLLLKKKHSSQKI